jgi:hypothetical protein
LAVHCCLKQEIWRRKGGTEVESETDIQIHMTRIIGDQRFGKRLVSEEKLMNFVRNVELKLFPCDAFDSFDPPQAQPRAYRRHSSVSDILPI